MPTKEIKQLEYNILIIKIKVNKNIMVRIEKSKIIIEIETNMPLSDLTDYQKAIIDVLGHYQPEGSDSATNHSLGNLLQELMPTFEQSKEVYSAVLN